MCDNQKLHEIANCPILCCVQNKDCEKNKKNHNEMYEWCKARGQEEDKRCKVDYRLRKNYRSGISSEQCTLLGIHIEKR